MKSALLPDNRYPDLSLAAEGGEQKPGREEDENSRKFLSWFPSPWFVACFRLSRTCFGGLASESSRTKTTCIIALLIFGLTFHLKAQVAIDADPEESATLNVGIKTGASRGLLIPRLGYSAGLAQWAVNAEPKTHSLLLFDPEHNYMVFWNNTITNWQIINPWSGIYSEDPPFNQSTIYTEMSTVGIGTSTPDESRQLHVNGNTRIDGTLEATRIVGEVPPGGIIMYSGALGQFDGAGRGLAGTPYEGWQLCNGQNGAPDLRGRFVVGYNNAVADYNAIGNTGGTEQVALTVNQMPSHTHTMQAAGLHTHTYQGPLIAGDHPGGSNGYDRPNQPSGGDTGPAGEHVHTINPTGGGQPHENRPPYYVLAFIMKL